MTFPQNIENVDNKFTSFFRPLVNETTSFPASILKQPPKNAPLIALKKKYATISG